MDKVVAIDSAMAQLADRQVLMIGGFLARGTPETLVDAVLASGATDLTVIANDTGFVDAGIGRLVVAGRIAKAIVSHMGTNKETIRQVNEGAIEVELVPQGTLIERIRCRGAGLGGVLTPTGVGTLVEEGKTRINSGGRDYLLELPLGADVALVKAWKADRSGNLVFRRLARNFNPIIAMAADLVVVEAEQVVEIGDLDPDEIMTPGTLVDMVVDGEPQR